MLETAEFETIQVRGKLLLYLSLQCNVRSADVRKCTVHASALLTVACGACGGHSRPQVYPILH